MSPESMTFIHSQTAVCSSCQRDVCHTKAVCELHTKLEPQTLIAMQGLSYILDHHTVAIWSKVKSQSIFYMSPKSQISNTCKSIADETFPVKKFELYYGTESTLWKKKQKKQGIKVYLYI